MKRGEAPGRGRQAGPDPLRTVGAIVIATCTILAMLWSAPRRRYRSAVAAAGQPAAPAPAPAQRATGPAAPQLLSFETLGGFEPGNIPASIQALDGRVVRIEGNVMPVKMSGKHLAAFMLMAFVPNCCFGQEPRVNDWVMVGVPPDLALSPTNLDYAVVTGRLVVKPVKDSSGELVGLFALHATAVTPAEGPATH